MSETIIVALIGAVPSILVAAFSIVSNNQVIKVRIDELEKSVAKHNNIVERTYKLESDMMTVWKRYDDMAERIDKIEKK